MFAPERITRAVSVGGHEVMVAVAGARLVPTADGAACCSCSTSCSMRKK